MSLNKTPCYKAVLMLPQTNRYTYLVVICIGLLFVFFSNPFLRYPYDIFAHLIAIDELYHGAAKSTTSIPEGRLLWHSIWAKLFDILNLGSQQFFLRAKIIHSVQTSVTLLMLYYFSHVVIRNIFKKIDNLTLFYVSSWSVMIWLSIFATHSGVYHLVWNLWYSVNYQITLPLFFYIAALTIVLFLEDSSLIKKIFFSVQIILISFFILKVHSMEFMYYLMYIAVFSFFYIDKLYQIFKRYYLLFIVGFIGFIYLIKNYQVETPKIFKYLNIEKFPELYETIIMYGNHVLYHFNRANTVINEFMYFIFYVIVVFFILILWKEYQGKSQINIRLLLVILTTSLFILIPQYQFSAGLFALITRSNVVHRIYFSSSLFILLPVFIYYLSQTYKLKLRYVNLLFVLIFLSIYSFSKHSAVLNHNYYKNIQSLKASFGQSKFDFHLNKKQISTIGELMLAYEKENKSGKEIYYYARTDIAFVIKYLYHKKVYWEGRRSNVDYLKHYNEDPNVSDYKKVLFEVPDGFPQYVGYL